MKIIDLTLTLDNECLTCGTPWHEKVQINPLGRLSEVGRNTTSIHLGSHSGTHIDAPSHFFENTYGIDSVSLETVCGAATIIDLSAKKRGDLVSVEDLLDHPVTTRMIFVFRWFQYWKTERYYDDFPYFTEEAIDYLIRNGLKVMALDTPSPDSVRDIGNKVDSINHKKLLKAGVVIIEYLTDTDKLTPGKQYFLVALPLKLKNVDGSPARVIALEKPNSIDL